MGFASLFERKQTSDPAIEPEAAPASDDLGTGSLADRLLRNRRYCAVLNANQETTFDDHTLALAWTALEDEMALVPGRELAPSQLSEAQSASATEIGAIYVDRFAVSNAAFARFVADGGYSRTELWPQEIWPNVLQFVDTTGNVGPRLWKESRPPRNRNNHPVVGVCWYEANAFAQWTGKRLPTAEQWQHTVSLCTGKDGRDRNVRYPWGNSFDPARCNTWFGGPGETAPVDSYYEGCTPNGIYQLVGNVWEWVATPFRCGTSKKDVEIRIEQQMAQIRGGAFNTYFQNQATCQFRTGQPFLFRGRNVGFRCCVSADQLTLPPDPSAFL